MTMKAAAVFLAILAVAAAVSGETPIGETAPPRRTVHLADPERILGFHSDIVLLDDGSLKVTETIEVIALGREIRRGIYRDFPAPRGSSGKDKESGFKIIEVLRDGEAEPYHTVTLSSCTRVYMGKADLLLEPGEYTYTFTYLTKRGAETAASEEELYWNVNGLKWQFPMDKISATITLPEGISAETVLREGYTGKRGKRGLDYRSWINGSGRIRFETTRPFLPGECLTILLRWSKGIVSEPTYKGYADKTIELPPFHGEKKRVAVLDLTMTENIDKALAIPLSDQLRAELFETGHFIMMDRKNMQDILEEQDFQYSGRCDSIESLVKIGKILRVQKMVSGSLGKIGESYLISLKMVDIETAEINSVSREKCIGMTDQLVDGVCVAAKKLVQIYESGK